MRVVTAPLDNVDVTVTDADAGLLSDAAGAFAPALVLVATSVACGNELESAAGFVYRMRVSP